ncbi:MAG: histidine triad nucleotide-binding protein [Clostridiales bacterium]|nr:MAG: histidine triad nucleotide-binding protein [Clostridiales bacterium]
MSQCIFCKIVAGEIPSAKVYEDDQVLAFKDIEAQAPVHILVIPKKHIGSILEVKPEDAQLMTHILEVIQKIAVENGLAQSGFRIAVNTGRDGGQTVPHLHFHILGGRAMAWPPG